MTKAVHSTPLNAPETAPDAAAETAAETEPTVTDEGPGRKLRANPRKCLVHGAGVGRRELIRFVRDPDGRLTFDLAEKLPGRGAWLTPTRSALAEARRKSLFARAFRSPTLMADDLEARLDAALRERIAERLGLARRSGVAVDGHDKLMAAIAGGFRVGLLIQARDGAADQKRRVATRLLAANPALACAGDMIDGAELAGALGRDSAIVHVGIAPGGHMQSLIRDLARLSLLNSNDSFTGSTELDR